MRAWLARLLPPGRRRARAQAITEFSLVMPVFVLSMLAVVEFSRLLFTYVSLVNGTREMARAAAISRSPDADAIDAFNNMTLLLGAVSPGDQITITVFDATGASAGATVCSLPPAAGTCSLPTSRKALAGGAVQVRSDHRFQLVPLFQGPLGLTPLDPTLNLSTTSRAYLE